jgi:hypothetical protein
MMISLSPKELNLLLDDPEIFELLHELWIIG